MSSNDLGGGGGAEIWTGMSANILRRCPGYVVCPVLCPQIFIKQASPFPTKLEGRENNCAPRNVQIKNEMHGEEVSLLEIQVV